MTATVKNQPGGKRQAWKALEAHYKKVSKLHLRDLFAKDPKRGERLVVDGVGLLEDYSKNRITEETLQLLLRLAEEADLKARIEAMFRGDESTSPRTGRSHTALRAPRDAPSSSTARMLFRKFIPWSTGWPISQRVRSGEWKGYTGSAFATLSMSGLAAPTRAGYGLRSAQALWREGHDLSVYIERGWHRFR